MYFLLVVYLCGILELVSHERAVFGYSNSGTLLLRTQDAGTMGK